jgi:hypothetical protein
VIEDEDRARATAAARQRRPDETSVRAAKQRGYRERVKAGRDAKRLKSISPISPTARKPGAGIETTTADYPRSHHLRACRREH